MALKPFYNKKGHLGMTRAELKDALDALPTPEAGDAGKAVVVNADADGYELGEAGKNQVLRIFFSNLNTTPTCDYSRSEIYQFLEGGGIVLASSDRFDDMNMYISGSEGVSGNIFKNQPYSNTLWYYNIIMTLDDHAVPPAEQIIFNQYSYSFTPTP